MFRRGIDSVSKPSFNPVRVRGRIESGRYWLWCVEDRPVHLSGLNPISFGAQRIAPVYTPPADRGRGWASAAVAQLGRQFLPRVPEPAYTAIGFEPVVDMANLVITASRYTCSPVTAAVGSPSRRSKGDGPEAGVNGWPKKHVGVARSARRRYPHGS